MWYHDHALGITRLNVYAGMAGFYIIRDDFDTGLFGNPLDLPAFPYEAAFAIQDKMFKDNGELFYPAFPGDPFYDDFITGEGAVLPADVFPGGGPTGLAEFFGDHMVVNGKIWPKMDVEPRNYRLRFLNGCDSRFLVVQFFEVPPEATDFSAATGPLPFTVIGSDQGLASSPTTVDTLLSETGSRYDMIFDFKSVTAGNRVIMKNIGGDEPFGGDIPGPQIFGETDRIMAFDVVLPLDTGVPDVTPTGINFGPVVPTPTRLRKVALFEGKDEYGRLQPLLGTAEPATDYAGNPINWPPEYDGADRGRARRTALRSDGRGDRLAQPDHREPGAGLHREVGDLERHRRRPPRPPAPRELRDPGPPGDRVGLAHDRGRPGHPERRVGRRRPFDGTYLVVQPVVQHNGLLGTGFRIVNQTYGPASARRSGRLRRERTEGHGDGAPGPDHPDQGDLRQARSLRVALPHPLPRGPRDDARHARRPRCLIGIDHAASVLGGSDARQSPPKPWSGATPTGAAPGVELVPTVPIHEQRPGPDILGTPSWNRRGMLRGAPRLRTRRTDSLR